MITNLHIKNLGIIKDIELELGEKFNVLTGETGAGKSLIIDSLNILAGGRFSKEMIRRGEEYLFVEANLFFENKDEDEKNVIVSRQISLNGKNICKINGNMVTVNQLKEYMSSVVDIHLQNDNNKLLNKKNHIEFLDSYDFNILNLKTKYQELYFKYLKLKNELSENLGDEKERKRTLDLLEYELNEIEEANLTETEDELENNIKLIKNSEKILNSLNESKEELDNALPILERVMRNFSKISDIKKEYNESYEITENSFYNLKEVYDSICNMQGELDVDEYSNEQFFKRLDLISTLKRKYGNTIAEILDYKKKVEENISKINNMESYVKNLNKELDTIKKEMLDISQKLHYLRVNNAIKISDYINEQLIDIEMKDVKISVNIEYDETNIFDINGQDRVEFLVKTNVGAEFLPLTKIASGGEISRIMLAIKTVLCVSNSGVTLVLDEIDTGISGAAASKVAEKLQKISKNMQILCVTHLSNIAAVADNNFYIYKETQDGNALTKIKLLSEEEKINEIARISFGKISEVAINYALELKKQKINA